MILLYSHVRTGRWASVMPAKLAETLGLTDVIRAIPITDPEAVQTIGARRAGARADDAQHRGAGGRGPAALRRNSTARCCGAESSTLILITVWDRSDRRDTIVAP